jgi:hypothetical protein
MRAVRVTARLLAAMLCIAAVGACTHHPGRPPRTTTPPTTTPPASGPLYEYSAEGGLCPWGLCTLHVSIDRSGAWHTEQGTRNVETNGRFDAATTKRLVDRIEYQVDSLADLPPLDGFRACPSRYDGSDVTFTLHVKGRTTAVSNCDPTDQGRAKDFSDNDLLRFLMNLNDQLKGNASELAGPLVQWTATGGFCAGACPVDIVSIQDDGSWQAMHGETYDSGHLDAASLARLKALIASGSAGLAQLPPASYCPSAADGRDVDVTFFTDDTWAWASNCRNNFAGNELLTYTSELVNRLF